MTNPLRGEVPLKLDDGRSFTLVLDHEALIVGEATYGKPVKLLLADAFMEFAGAMRAILYGALRAHHPATSLDDAAELVFDHGGAVTAALEAAVKASFPATEGDRKRANPPRPPRGKSSGRSGAKPGSIPSSSSNRHRPASS